ncbi:thiol:disulfide oxidoreductase [Acetobacter cibinongensis]|uniref:Glutathione S-transferase n=1 Tax=Acetobacter cibinongensis TaxID=146475 RepID=A0A0D6N075_9PROT|nr:glutathione S-transferase N-terminal domain-containing protein [Acetobacter cibinongensis]GAN59397.1 glutathione S-transferase [Acetobacter cibinongensis]GBQ15577.1 glutathione S-transferase [Acetobacter cibinongensis NRIC 0482]GEL59741.1 thiol:disulfide oxidoreductase [Acetobacter cibinongensis]
MLEVYAFATPNSVKVTIALEELALPYTLHGVNVRKGEQKAPQFLALNPNGKVPVLTETDETGQTFVLTESAAILVFLAEKTGRLLPAHGEARAKVVEQLFFHASGLSPAFGQSGFFQRFAAKPEPIALERFATEASRTLRVLDAVLAKNKFAAGDEFTIADIAHFGWLWRRSFPNLTLEDTPHVARWYADMERRAAVQRGIARIEALVTQD